MHVDARGARLTPAELDALVETLVRIARTHYVGELGTLIAYLTGIAGEIAVRLRDESEVPTMTVTQYATATGMSERTVRHQCQRGAIDARKTDHKWQLIATVPPT